MDEHQTLCNVETNRARSDNPAAGGVLHVDIRGIGERKAFTDQRLMLHGLEYSEHDSECAFVVASSDKDFAPLIVTLRRRGHAVFVACFEDTLSDEISRVATSIIKLRAREVGGGFVSPLDMSRVLDIAELLARCSGVTFFCLSAAVHEACACFSDKAPEAEVQEERFPDAALASLLKESLMAREAVNTLAEAASLKKAFIQGLSGNRGWGKLQLQVALRLLLYTPVDKEGKLGGTVSKRRAAAEIGLLLDVCTLLPLIVQTRGCFGGCFSPRI